MVQVTRRKSSRLVIFLAAVTLTFLMESLPTPGSAEYEMVSGELDYTIRKQEEELGNLTLCSNQSSNSNFSFSLNTSCYYYDYDDESSTEKSNAAVISLGQTDSVKKRKKFRKFSPHLVDPPDQKGPSTTTETSRVSTQQPQQTTTTTATKTTTTTTTTIMTPEPEPATEIVPVPVDQVSTPTVQSETSQSINNAQTPNYNSSLNHSTFPPSTTETTTMPMTFPLNPSTVAQTPENTVTENSPASTPTNTQTQKVESTLSTTEKTAQSPTPNPNPNPTQAPMSTSTLTQSSTQIQSLSSAPDSNATTPQPPSSSPSFNSTNPTDSEEEVYNLSYSCGFKSSQTPCEEVTAQIPLLTLVGEYAFFHHAPNFYIHHKNMCIKNMTIDICGQQLDSSTSDGHSNSALVDSGSGFSPTLQKCCPMGAVVLMKTSEDAGCTALTSPPWKPGNFIERNQSGIRARVDPNYNVGDPPCESLDYILPHQLKTQVHGGKYSEIIFKDVRVLENGGVETRESGNHKWRKLEKNTYCIDGFYNDNSTLEEHQNFMVLHCEPEVSASSVWI